MSDTGQVISPQESASEVDLAKASWIAELDGPDDETSPVEETPVAAKADETPPTPENTEPEKKLEENEEVTKEPATKEADPALASMRDLMREIRRENAILKARQERQDVYIQQLKKTATAPPPDEDDDLLGVAEKANAPVVTEPDPSAVELLEGELSRIGHERGDSLNLLLETMSFHPQYTDIKDVCSKSNFNDLIDALAPEIAREKKVDITTAGLMVEASIWKLPNPYQWMYKVIKENHPRYRSDSKAPAVEASAESKETKPSLEQKKPPEVPPSIAGLGGESVVHSSGWTATKIDAMDEFEYSKIPNDIKEKYLSGELP